MEARLKLQECIEVMEGEDGEGRKVGCWSIHQNLLYSIFVDQNKLVMISKKKRKKLRIFDQMSKFIGSRNSLQCRSHHQKLIQKLGEIKQIVNAFKKYFGKEVYRQNYKLLTGKKVRQAGSVQPSLIKLQDNACLDYCPSSLNELESDCGLEEGLAASPVKEERQEVAGNGENNETPIPLCKAQQSIQYYAPFGYYIDNTVAPFQFYGIYYPIQNSQ